MWPELWCLVVTYTGFLDLTVARWKSLDLLGAPQSMLTARVLVSGSEGEREIYVIFTMVYITNNQQIHVDS